MYDLKYLVLSPSAPPSALSCKTTTHLPQVPHVSTILMRLPSVSTIVRTFYNFTNVTRLQIPERGLSPFVRGTAIRSMPTIPFLGSLFSSSSSSANMTYPDQRNDQEWQAVLNKGGNPLLSYLLILMLTSDRRTIQNPPTKRHRTSRYR